MSAIMQTGTTPGTGGAGQGGPARPGGGSADGGAGGGGDYPPRKRNARSDSNETPDPGYGSRTSKNSSTHKSKKKKQKVVRSLQGALKVLIFIEILILLTILCCFYAVATKRITIEAREWTTQVVPGVGEFEDFAVSTSNEHCSEIARTLFVEGVKINLIALAMKFCLDVEQPDRSGKYGSSVAVHYSEKTGCRSSQGDTMMSKEVGLVDNFVHEVAVDPLSESRGPFSELVPADMVTILALIEDSTEEERMLAMSLLKMEHDDKMIALTINGVDPNEIGFLIKVDILFDKAEELSRRQRGDVVVVPNFDSMLHNYFTADRFLNKTLFAEYLSDLVTSSDRDKPENEKTFLDDDAMLRDVLGRNLWSYSNTTSEKHDRVFCHPSYPSIGGLLFPAFNRIYDEQEDEDFLLEGYSIIDHATDIVLATLKDLYESVFFHNTADAWIRLYDMVDAEEGTNRPMGGNYFTLITQDDAYAYTSTIGSGFGSLTTRTFMNNLVHNFATYFNVTKGFSNTNYPFISVQNGKVDIAYSGTAGYTTLSMGIPRLIFVLSLYYLHRVPLEFAVCYPLFFLAPQRNIYYTYLYPLTAALAHRWLVKNMYEGEVTVQEAPKYFGDSLSAVYRKNKGGINYYIPFYKNKRAPFGVRQFNTRVIGV
ncbi:hypothetical protein Q1695_013945 [Nippostrongylus brasiliensis]|nr:hypothetical protein Q1695_013945 [Nippostrongylus brasiliensis]